MCSTHSARRRAGSLAVCQPHGVTAGHGQRLLALRQLRPARSRRVGPRRVGCAAGRRQRTVLGGRRTGVSSSCGCGCGCVFGDGWRQVAQGHAGSSTLAVSVAQQATECWNSAQASEAESQPTATQMKQAIGSRHGSSLSRRSSRFAQACGSKRPVAAIVAGAVGCLQQIPPLPPNVSVGRGDDVGVGSRARGPTQQSVIF